MSREIIDFDPATIGEIYMNNQCAVIDFPGQNMFGEDVEVAIEYRCQLRIQDGDIERNIDAPNTVIDEFEVRTAKEARSCFLPIDYEVFEPVSYVAKLNGNVVARVTGSSLKLSLICK